MKRIHLTITALSPLAIGQRKPGGSVSEAMDYIPGSMIRGAIAGEILKYTQQVPETGDDFYALFLDETAAIFGNAYPANAKISHETYIVSDHVSYLPTTAFSAKANSGFKPDKAGVFDALIDSYCAREHQLFYAPNDEHGEPIEPYSGFYSTYAEKHGKQKTTRYLSHSVSKRLLTKVGINRRRATAQEEVLFSIEVLNEFQGGTDNCRTVYKSSILVPDNPQLAQQLCQFIQHNRDRFRLGGAVSRGLGWIEIEASIEAATVPIRDVQSRVDRFNQVLMERMQFWNLFETAIAPTPEQLFFTIDLQADAILRENWRRTMVISPELLSRFVDVPFNSDLQLQMSYSSYGYRSGWNAAWRCFKDIELVTQLGSVFLFSVPLAQKDLWIEKLAALELSGVGDRTHEGFGQIRVCHEFHQVMREAPV